MRKLIILGASGNSLSIYDAVADHNALLSTKGEDRIDVIGFLDDTPALAGTAFCDKPILGPLEAASRYAACEFINGIASIDSYTSKPAIVARTGVPIERFMTVVHPTAAVSRQARIGRGSAIMANCSVCAEAGVGDHVIMLQNSVVNHHSVVHDFATISSLVTILGYVTIGTGAFIGGASALRPRVTVGARALVGMGSVVICDVADDAVVVGNPARALTRRQTESRLG
ncbi:MAG: sugar O-acyltransferase [Alphaproteobacteria bacterium]|nr:sugar O-acyltransferase [Alphaproteobacteria bacterium]